MNNSQWIFLSIFFILLIFILVLQLKSEKRKITIETGSNKSELTAELADNIPKQMRGLMFRSSLPETEGMLFVFADEQKRGFWMMNTSIPLEALHVNSKGIIVDIVSMEPCKSISCPTYTGKEPAEYVLEVNSGFVKKNGIIIGKSRLINLP